MGWNAPKLNSSVMSAYTQYDNLVDDVRAGKVWDTAESYYISTTHNGTNGVIDTSSGDIHLKPAGGNTLFYDTAGTKSLDVSHNGTHVTYLASQGNHLFKVTAAGDCAMRIYDSTLANKLSTVVSATDVSIASDVGNIKFHPATGIVDFDLGTTPTQFYFNDAAGVKRTVTITALGAWSIV